MRLIRSLQGIAAFRLKSEDVFPASSPPIQNIVSGIKALFDFAIGPAAESLGTGTPIIFQVGKLAKDNHEFGIHHLIMLPDGDIVAAANTEVSEYALDIFIEYLENKFEYRFADKITRYYSSTVVVEFDKKICEIIPSLKAIQNIIGDMCSDCNSFEILRLAFSRGTGSQPATPSGSPLDSIENTDFIIERRAGQPFSTNHFFCTAPMRTEEHIKTLDKIEKLLPGS